MELYWYIVVIIFIIIKIFFYVCWYRSRQRQLAAYLSNPRNAQIVIVGGRAYLHQMCERQSVQTILEPFRLTASLKHLEAISMIQNLPKICSVNHMKQQTSVWPSWYGVQDDLSIEEPSTALPPAASFSHLDMPPPYEAVSGEDDLKPPPYSECAHGDEAAAPRPSPYTPLISEGGDSISVNEAPPPYTPSPPTQVDHRDGPVSHSESRAESRST